MDSTELNSTFSNFSTRQAHRVTGPQGPASTVYRAAPPPGGQHRIRGGLLRTRGGKQHAQVDFPLTKLRKPGGGGITLV